MSELIRDLHEAIGHAEAIGIVHSSVMPRSEFVKPATMLPNPGWALPEGTLVRFTADFTNRMKPAGFIYSVLTPPDAEPDENTNLTSVMGNDGLSVTYNVVASLAHNNISPNIFDSRFRKIIAASRFMFTATLGEGVVQLTDHEISQLLYIESIRTGTAFTHRSVTATEEYCLADYKPALQDKSIQDHTKMPESFELQITERQTYATTPTATQTIYTAEVLDEGDFELAPRTTITVAGPAECVNDIGGQVIYKPDRRALARGDVDIISTDRIRRTDHTPQAIVAGALHYAKQAHQFVDKWGETLWFLSQSMAEGNEEYHKKVLEHRLKQSRSLGELERAQYRDGC